MRDAPGPREEERRHVFNQVSQFTVELESSVAKRPGSNKHRTTRDRRKICCGCERGKLVGVNWGYRPDDQEL